MTTHAARGPARTDFRPAKLSRSFVRLMRLVNRYYVMPRAKLRCEVRDAAKLAGLPPGVIIAPNHSEYADAMVVTELFRVTGRFVTFMVTRESFDDRHGLNGVVMQRMGGFSVNRGGENGRCQQFAKDVLAAGRYDLLIFPEGEIYLLNDLVMPFKPGVAMLALEAAVERRRAGKTGRPLLIVPVAIKYVYLEEIAPRLGRLAAQLETTLFGAPKDGPLYERAYALGVALLARTEQDLGLRAEPGEDVYDRVRRIREYLLTTLEHRYLGRVRQEDAFDRARWLILHLLEELAAAGARRDLPPHERDALSADLRRDLVRAQMAARSVSFAEDYVVAHPTPERMAETLMKLEREICGRYPAPLNVRRKAVIRVGAPIDVTEFLPAYAERKTRKDAILRLVGAIQAGIQAMLDAANAEIEQARDRTAAAAG